MALSDGSFSAAVNCLGWLQSLQSLDILRKLRYISSVSGASWIAGPLCYLRSHEQLTKFLGEYLYPDECTIANLITSVKSEDCFGSCLTDDAVLSNLISFENCIPGIDSRDLWSNLVGKLFFKKFGLNNSQSYPAMCKSDLSTHYRPYENPKFPIDYCLPMSQIPFPIINADIQIDNIGGVLPIEFTPLYYGIPIQYNIINNKKEIIINSYLIEPISFLSIPKKLEMNSNIIMNSTNKSTTVILSYLTSLVSISEQD